MKKTKIIPIYVDQYGVMTNTANNALWIHNMVIANNAVAVPIDVGNMTMFNMSFVYLKGAVPVDVVYSDGSNHGIQINIDRGASYAIGIGNTINEHTYVMEKWNLSQSDAEALLPFFNTVISGKDCFPAH